MLPLAPLSRWVLVLFWLASFWQTTYMRFFWCKAFGCTPTNWLCRRLCWHFALLGYLDLTASVRFLEDLKNQSFTPKRPRANTQRRHTKWDKSSGSRGCNFSVCCVVSSRDDAPGLGFAKEKNIPFYIAQKGNDAEDKILFFFKTMPSTSLWVSNRYVWFFFHDGVFGYLDSWIFAKFYVFIKCR